MDYALIILSAALVNNFVLVQFLGLCPFMGVSRQVEGAMGMALATAFVLTLSAVASYLLSRWVLVPLGLEYLNTLAFILVIAALVQLTELVMRQASPLLYRVLGLYLPLITSNCAVLGVALPAARGGVGRDASRQQRKGQRDAVAGLLPDGQRFAQPGNTVYVQHAGPRRSSVPPRGIRAISRP